MSEPKLKLPRLGVDPSVFSGASVFLCGTYAGAQRHRSRREAVCDPCREAAAEYQAWRRFRTGHVHTPRQCPDCGSVFAQHKCGGQS